MDNSAEENERHCQVETAGLLVAFTKHLLQAGIRRHLIVPVSYTHLDVYKRQPFHNNI